MTSRRRKLGCLLLFASVAWASGCRRETPAAKRESPPASAVASSASPAPEPPRPTPALNVLLINIDSWRADTPWTGYPRDVTPRIDAFRKQRCVTYTNGYALSSYTAKSVVPALVGEYPSAMVRDANFFTRYPDDKTLFVSERAQQAGHRTLAAHAHGYFLPLFQATQGFDDARTLPGGVDLRAVTSVTSEPLTRLAIEQLSAPENTRLAGDRRFFAFVHYMDPHHSYEKHDGHPDWGWKTRDVYDNELHYTDHWVGELLDFARRQPWWDETAVIITSDHGEGFGEHNHYRHGFELWETVIRVPWLVCLPGVPTRTLAVRRSQIDLAPTIADLLKIPAKPAFRGVSLLPEVRGGVAPERRRIVADLPRSDLMDRRRALIDGDRKIIAFGDDASFMLFDLAKDPDENSELGASHPGELAEMKRLYAEESAKIPLVEVLPGPDLKGAPPGRRW